MKFYHAIVLIYVAYYATADQDADVNADCKQKIQAMDDAEIKCVRKVIGEDEFRTDYNATILKYNANEMDGVQPFLNKYCTNSLEFLDCRLNIKPAASELDCEIRPKFRKLQPAIFQGVKTMVMYVCDNDAEMFKKLLPYDSIDTLFFDSDLQRCHTVSSDLTTVDELCEVFDSVLDCMQGIIGDHKNKDIAVIVNEAIARAKTTIGC